jgi:hypothetical protein
VPLDYSVPTTTLSVTYSSDADIYGFQFVVDGASLVSASGGEAETAFDVVNYNPVTGIVLGFSIAGSFIEAGSGTLIELELEGDDASACITGLVLSGAEGSNLDAVVDCLAISYIAPILGCMDAAACNYNADATEDDGSCLSNDCLGICGGSALIDDCGICNGGNADQDECGVCFGSGIPEGNCDCDGNVLDCADECGGDAVEDCNGDCDGAAVVDDCGICGGASEAGCFIELSIGSVADGSMEILMNNTIPISGFQFNITGVVH